MLNFKFFDSFCYAYSYSASIPYGMGYGIGVYCEDDDHDIIAFDESEKVNNWRRAISNGRTFEYLRDIFNINVISAAKVKITKITQFIDEVKLLNLNDNNYILILSNNEVDILRQELISANLLIAYHQAGAFSQSDG